MADLTTSKKMKVSSIAAALLVSKRKFVARTRIGKKKKKTD
jgi:hypothetical protein